MQSWTNLNNQQRLKSDPLSPIPRTSNEHKFPCVWKCARLINFCLSLLAKCARVLQKDARFKPGWGGWPKQNCTLFEIALGCAELRWFAHNCAHCCVVFSSVVAQQVIQNPAAKICQVSKQGFLRVWLKCTRFGKLRVFCQYLVV